MERIKEVTGYGNSLPSTRSSVYSYKDYTIFRYALGAARPCVKLFEAEGCIPPGIPALCGLEQTNPGKEHYGSTMIDGELKYPRWQTPLQEAILEFDPEKLSERIQNVKTLMFERLQEMSSDTSHHDERQALADAASILRGLKKDKLS
jgi:hypothetical protein